MYLVRSPAAVEFLGDMSTDTFCKARLGDPEKVGAKLAPHVHAARSELQDAIGKLRGLNGDKVRSLPEKHHAAMILANRVVPRLKELAEAYRAESKSLATEAQAMGRSYFAMSPQRQALDADLRSWVRETVKTEGGHDLLKQAIKDAPQELLPVVYSSPYMVLGMSKDVHFNYQAGILKEYLPDAYAKAEQAVMLSSYPDKVAAVAREVPGSFYEPHQVEAASTRVNIDA